jgi:hypothetical protein
LISHKAFLLTALGCVSLASSAEASWCKRAFIATGRALGIIEADVYDMETKLISDVEELAFIHRIHSNRDPVKWGTESVEVPPLSKNFSFLKESRPTVLKLKKAVDRLESVQDKNEFIIAVSTYARLADRLEDLLTAGYSINPHQKALDDLDAQLDSVDEMQLKLSWYYKADRLGTALDELEIEIAKLKYRQLADLMLANHKAFTNNKSLSVSQISSTVRRLRVVATKIAAHYVVLNFKPKTDLDYIKGCERLAHMAWTVNQILENPITTLVGPESDLKKLRDSLDNARAHLNKINGMSYR